MNKSTSFNIITGIILTIFWACVLLRLFLGIRLFGFEFLRIIFYTGILSIIVLSFVSKYVSNVWKKILKVNLIILISYIFLAAIPVLGYSLFWEPVGIVTGQYREIVYEDKFITVEKENSVIMSGGQHRYFSYTKHGLYDKIKNVRMLFDTEVDNYIYRLKK